MGAAFALFFAGLATRRWEFFALTLTLILYPYVAFSTRPSGTTALKIERRLATEQVMAINTAAAGGNAGLLAQDDG